MNIGDLKKLAELRKTEATILLGNGCYDGTYYLAGYAVECVLKAVIAKMTKEHDFPDKKRVLDSYVHDLNKLLKVAELEKQLDKRCASNNTFLIKWQTVTDWNEASRYETHDAQKAKSFLKAAFETGGVLEWLETHW